MALPFEEHINARVTALEHAQGEITATPSEKRIMAAIAGRA